MNGIKHDEKIWNAPHKLFVMYRSGWDRGKKKFSSYDECEKYLKQEFGDETHIDLIDEEVGDAAMSPALTMLCGNWQICASIMNED